MEAAGEWARLGAVEQWNTFQARDEAPPEYKIPKTWRRIMTLSSVAGEQSMLTEDKLVAGWPATLGMQVPRRERVGSGCRVLPDGAGHHVPRICRSFGSPPHPPLTPIRPRVGGCGYARRREFAHAHFLAVPSRWRFQEPPGLDAVNQEGLNHIQTHGGGVPPIGLSTSS